MISNRFSIAYLGGILSAAELNRRSGMAKADFTALECMWKRSPLQPQQKIQINHVKPSSFQDTCIACAQLGSTTQPNSNSWTPLFEKRFVFSHVFSAPALLDMRSPVTRRAQCKDREKTPFLCCASRQTSFVQLLNGYLVCNLLAPRL